MTHSRSCKCCPCPHSSAGKLHSHISDNQLRSVSPGCPFSGQDGDLTEHLKGCQYENIKGFIEKSDQQWLEIKRFMAQKEEESTKVQEMLTNIQKQLAQVLSAMETQNGRTESSLDYLRTSVEEMKLQVDQNRSDIAALQTSPGKVTRRASGVNAHTEEW